MQALREAYPALEKKIESEIGSLRSYLESEINKSAEENRAAIVSEITSIVEEAFKSAPKSR